MNYAIVGHGRMGREIDALATSRGHRRVAVIDVPMPPDKRLDPAALHGAEVAFEFTRPEAAEANVVALVEAEVPVVCGTTGWQPTERLRRAVSGAKVGVVLAPNFSVGVNLFFRIVDHAARLLAAGGLFDPYVQEMHHRGKKDAPSGTALRLAEALLDADPRKRTIVEGNPNGGLPEGAIQVSSTRAGSEPGSHTVGFDGAYDRIVLAHCARGREGFALGAILAAEWLGRRSGLHTFEEILGEILGEAKEAGS